MGNAGILVEILREGTAGLVLVMNVDPHSGPGHNPVRTPKLGLISRIGEKDSDRSDDIGDSKEVELAGIGAEDSGEVPNDVGVVLVKEEWHESPGHKPSSNPNLRLSSISGGLSPEALCDGGDEVGRKPFVALGGTAKLEIDSEGLVPGLGIGLLSPFSPIADKSPSKTSSCAEDAVGEWELMHRNVVRISLSERVGNRNPPRTDNGVSISAGLSTYVVVMTPGRDFVGRGPWRRASRTSGLMGKLIDIGTEGTRFRIVAVDMGRFRELMTTEVCSPFRSGAIGPSPTSSELDK